VRVAIQGFDLPGIRCGPNPAGEWYENIHVGLCTRSTRDAGAIEVIPKRPWTVIDIVAGDALEACWEFDVVLRHPGGSPDFGGPLVRGKRDDRHIALAWGEVSGMTFGLFRGLKLRLDHVNPDIVHDAANPARRLVARVSLTDRKGFPRCATVHPPDVAWSVE
jgi:hypothetical protein